MGDKLSSSDFVHLHNHTHHSLLDGLTKIPDLINKVKDFGMEAVAITDHGTMSGAIEFYKAANDKSIKPIIGLEAYVASRSRFDKDPQKDKSRYHLTILAMNNQGYKNLMQLSTLANLEGMYYKPRIDHELLEKYNQGLIILSGCASGELGENLRLDNYQAALDIAKWYKNIFGDRYYLELQDHGHINYPGNWDTQVKINQSLEKISKELELNMVVTSDAHYLTASDQEAHDILLCVGTGSFVSEQNRMSLKDFDLHVTDPKQIIDRWQFTNPDAIKNTKKIADRCHLEIELNQILIPNFPTPNKLTEKQHLENLVYQGLAWRYGNQSLALSKHLTVEQAKRSLPSHIIERADYELSVVDKMGFCGYFLIVQDFINWGKNKGIIFGPGRGSAAGSILAYSLRITELDPLKYDLLFERFLNPDRISMPDVDIDIQDTRRDEVIKYCFEKYGDDRVANIVTFGKMAARAAVRDVARVLEVPYIEADRLSKMIPPPVQGRHKPLIQSIRDDKDLKNEYQSNPTSKKVIDYAIKLEGTIRSHGVHAAGVVIAPDDIVKFTPLEIAQKGVVATQYSMGPIEELGLLKMDFLGLSNLTTINNTLRIIKKVNNLDLVPEAIPLNDLPTYQLLKRGETTGVFQLESAGMKRYLRELRPSTFEDIIAMVALYRPGPMQFIESFINRKHGNEQISYLHKKFENSLKETYGILVYQEQFMQISKDFAGFSGGQADTLRKAVGKKNIDLMRKVKIDFVNGAVKHSSVDPKLAELFWSQLEEFANYCFNKSHAACYALIAYWTAYLKAHYPEAFMAALMTSDHNDIDRLAIEISECNHMGITVLAPNVNESFTEFAVVPGKKQIRFGMVAVKGVGQGAVDEIIKVRSEGRFESIEDFAKRVSTQKFTKKAWESLIKTGGFDSFGDRSDLLFNLDSIQAYASKTQKEAQSSQTGLFDFADTSFAVNASIQIQPAPKKFTDREKLSWERELLGLYLSSHPLDNYDNYFNEQTMPLSDLMSYSNNANVVVGGLVSNIKTIVTKSGSKMAFLKIEDKTDDIEIVVFPNLYSKIGQNLTIDSVVKVVGKLNSKDKNGKIIEELKIIADEIELISDTTLLNYQPTGQNYQNHQSKQTDRKSIKPKKNNNESLYLHLKTAENHELLNKLKDSCKVYIGESSVILVIGENHKTAIKLPYKVDMSDELISHFVKLLGEDNVAVK